LYPALTAKNGAGTQKFFLRRVNVIPSSLIDTFNIVQDSAYQVIRKMTATIIGTLNSEYHRTMLSDKKRKDTQNGPDTSTYSITNILQGDRVLGMDANTANSRLYSDKTYEQTGKWTKWYFVDASPEDATLSSITLSTGVLIPAFCRILSPTLPLCLMETATVTPTAVAAITGATITGTGAVDVSSGTGVSTILVTATDGITKKTYTINYVILQVLLPPCLP